ncbi:hypothetical protein [Actinomadura decatromicini]|uniref:hypothetical protein n=1 Tax=Actinomadura decatromicini TaxID=2604572 RepID=UPI001CA37A10|nr:hypothetical protein [Actinomadura decatromicini]
MTPASPSRSRHARLISTHSTVSAAPVAGSGRRSAARRLWYRPRPAARPTSEADAAGRLTVLFDDLDFDPKPADGVIRLRHCPFLELAEEYGPLVCDVHLGLMQGALEELDAPLSADRLEPFAEPGACVAHLRRTPRLSSKAAGGR